MGPTKLLGGKQVEQSIGNKIFDCIDECGIICWKTGTSFWSIVISIFCEHFYVYKLIPGPKHSLATAGYLEYNGVVNVFDRSHWVGASGYDTRDLTRGNAYQDLRGRY